MSQEPTYPAEAAVGSEEGQAPAGASGGAGAAKAAEGKNKKLVTGVAMGIGSAAIVAALLYANRSKRGDKADKTDPANGGSGG